MDDSHAHTAGASWNNRTFTFQAGGSSASAAIPTTLTGFSSITSTTFVGALSGNATSANKVNNALSINGKSYDGSSAITVGTLGTAYGGTGTASAPVQGGVIYGASTSAYGCTAKGSNGQYLISQSTGAPIWTSAIIVQTSTPTSYVKGQLWLA